MKNFLIKSICLVLVTVTTFSLCGCFETIREYDVGDFRVCLARMQKEGDPNSYLCLLGLSEAGQKKKTIVLPKKINGHPYYLRFISTPGYGNTFFRGKAEKFYFEYPGDYSQDSNELRLIPLRLYGCTNLKKAFSNIIADVAPLDGALRYYNYYTMCFFYQKTYDKECEKLSVDTNGWLNEAWLANLQYMYNYEGAENHGYFWIDDIDNGEKVEVTPDTPEREGYTFGGWYTEEECVNKFDFNTVFNKPVLEVGETYPDDYVTYLYAKWIQNEG